MKKENKIIIPDVSKIAREMTGGSQVSIIVRRILKLSLYSKYLLIKNNIKYIPLLMKMDYAVGVKILCELEILQIKNRNNKRICLHFQMTDMAVAVNNHRVFKYFFDLAKTYKFFPGLATNNYYFLVKKLSDIKDIPDNLIIFTNCKVTDSFSKIASYKIKKL